MRKFYRVAVAVAAVATMLTPTAAQAKPKAPAPATCQAKLLGHVSLFGSPMPVGRSMFGYLIEPDSMTVTVDAVGGGFDFSTGNWMAGRTWYRIVPTAGLTFENPWYNMEVTPLTAPAWFEGPVGETRKWLKCEPTLPADPTYLPRA